MFLIVQSALSAIDAQANSTGNTALTGFAAQGIAGISAAQKAIDNIGQALIADKAPSTNEYVIHHIAIHNISSLILFVVKSQSQWVSKPHKTRSNVWLLR